MVVNGVAATQNANVSVTGRVLRVMAGQRRGEGAERLNVRGQMGMGCRLITSR
jgi:hypothetical protein